MDIDDKLEKQVNEYAAIAKENPNVNASMLMMNALQNSNTNVVSSKSKRWAYLISISIPFSGFLLALNYWMKDEDDARQVAWMCMVLTVVAAIMFWAGGALLLGSSGTSVDQISKIKVQDIQQLGQ